jgi:NAD(P)-dependent dehydrogenase (short-subunit alcohol dehydrogenase family)
MDLQLRDKVAVVTGAGRGIGLAITQRLHAEGTIVVANNRGPTQALTRLAEQGRVTVVLGDVTDPAEPARLVAAAGGTVDVLVNNAGAAPARPEGFLAIDDTQWAATFNLDLFAALRMIRAVLPGMLTARSGVVVNVGSINAKLPDPAVLDYSAAKAALANATKSLSKAYGRSGVRFTSVDPGPVATDLWNGDNGVARTLSRAGAGRPEDIAAQAAEAMATGRFSQPIEVATLVALLASPLLGNVTGTGFVIDGGMFPTL